MLRKFSTTIIICSALSFVPLIASAPVAQGHSSKAAADVIAGIAIGVLGAAIAEHHHKNGSPYQDHPNVSRKENDVGRCMKRTHEAMSNQGFYAVDLERTLNYHADEGDIQHVELEVGRTNRRNDARSHINVFCAIQGGRVVNFRHSHH